MNSSQYTHLLGLARAAGFTLDYAPDPILGRSLATYGGVSILVSNFIPNDEGAGNDETSIYFVHMGTRDGDNLLGGLVWFYSEDTGPGIRVDGPHRTSQATDTIFADLEINIGFASLSANAVLGMRQIAAT
jgi:hypothetical protein